MARLRLDLDDITYERLLAQALDERRPVHWQAEHILARSLARRTRQPDQPDRDLALVGPSRPQSEEAA